MIAAAITPMMSRIPRARRRVLVVGFRWRATPHSPCSVGVSSPKLVNGMQSVQKWSDRPTTDAELRSLENVT